MLAVAVNQVHFAGFHGAVFLVLSAVVVAFRRVCCGFPFLNAVNRIPFRIEEIALVSDTLYLINLAVSGSGMPVVLEVEPLNVSGGETGTVSFRTDRGIPGSTDTLSHLPVSLRLFGKNSRQSPDLHRRFPPNRSP